MVIPGTFGPQGLNRHLSQSAIALILDSPALTSTRMLIAHFRHKLKQIIIVERDPITAAQIQTNWDRFCRTYEYKRTYCPRVIIADGDVFTFLSRRRTRIDYMWLDLMASNIKEAQFLKMRHLLPSLKCLAITLTTRSREFDKGDIRGTYAHRIQLLQERMTGALDYEVLDYRYRCIPDGKKKSQHMGVIAFGKRAVAQ